MGKPVWIRHVIAPGLTDTPDSIDALGALLQPFSCSKRVELLPYRSFCLGKYRALGFPFPMENEPEPTAETVTLLAKRLQTRLEDIRIVY
jgi:pyruvate formate lyase activating enzyme